MKKDYKTTGAETVRLIPAGLVRRVNVNSRVIVKETTFHALEVSRPLAEALEALEDAQLRYLNLLRNEGKL